MKNIKSLLITLTLIFSINTAMTKKAEAGIVLLPATMFAIPVIGFGVATGGMGAFVYAIEEVFGGGETGMFMMAGGITLVVLDDDVSSNENMALGLKAKFPMINDQTIFEDLSDMIQYEVDYLKGNTVEVSIKLNEEEVRDVLSRIDLTGIEDNVESLIQELI